MLWGCRFMRNPGKILIFLVILFSLKAGTGEPNHKVPLFLSFVFPGGGQIYNRSYVKAAVYAAAEGVMVYGAITQHNRYKNSKDKLKFYKDEGDFYKIREYEYYADRYKRERNNFIWMGVAAVLLSAGDAWVDSHFKSFRRDLFIKGDELSVRTSGTGLKLVYEW